MNNIGRFAWFSLGALFGLLGVLLAVGLGGHLPAPPGWSESGQPTAALVAVGLGLVAVCATVQVVRLVHLPHPGRVWLNVLGVFTAALGGLLAWGAIEARAVGSVDGWSVGVTASQTGGGTPLTTVYVALASVFAAAVMYAASRYTAEYRHAEPPPPGSGDPGGEPPVGIRAGECRRDIVRVRRAVGRLVEWVSVRWPGR